MSYITLAGHSMRMDGDCLSLPCLGGEDTQREPSRILVTVKAGEPLGLTETYDLPLEVRGEETLQGWGKLDGPAVILAGFECAWTVSVPKAVLDAVTQRFGVTV